ncbi:MAG: arginase [Acidobacteria bacterium]|nr:MAG: arginase [Acidobacteriota bacterium]
MTRRLADPAIPSGPPVPPRDLDPDAPSGPSSGLFGLGLDPGQARFLALPVPWQATVSSGAGTIDGPRALVEASCQLDLCDPVLGEPWRHGFAALDEPADVRRMSDEVEALVARLRAGETALADEIDAAGDVLAAWVERAVGATLDGGRVPVVLGGEHAVSRGAFAAAAVRHPGLGILQLDAHADLRRAYEGLQCSHASVMRRALELDGVARIVQVAVRDLSREESRLIGTEPRIVAFPDHRIAAARVEGRGFAELAHAIVGALPPAVWVSVDVDGLDPSLCPGTGTPVPGGLSWAEACYLVDLLARSEARIVGLDVVEVGPSFWDGFVAARLVYRLCGAAAARLEPL